MRFRFVVDSANPDPVGRSIVEGTWEPSPAMRWLLATVSPGDTILDLGAHIGTFSVPAAAAGCTVVAVEASPRNVSLLRAAVEANEGFAIDVVHGAADAIPGELEFVEYGPFSTIASKAISATTGYPTVRVQALTVDSIPGQPFKWAKVDIEGAEVRALQGAGAVLSQLAGLIIESNGYALGAQDSSPEALVSELRRSGFSLYEANNQEIRPIPRRVFQPETTVDYIAVKARPNVPRGWQMSKVREPKLLAEALNNELIHPVSEHRQYAQELKGKAPLRVRRHLRQDPLSEKR